jgi:type IV pilus assembly protein PilO
MTAGNFSPTGEKPAYPTVFGLTLTPTVNGVIFAILGIGGAIYMFTSLVQPQQAENQALSEEIATKEGQLQNQAELQQQIEDAKKRVKAAEQLRADVLTMFASKESVDTLLIDVNERVKSVNAGLTEKDQADLNEFTLDAAKTGVINDSSLGSQVNGRLERQVYDIKIEGSFPQTQSIIRNIERLQPLLVVTDFKSDLDETQQSLTMDSQGNPIFNNFTKIATSFKLSALLPVASQQPAASADPADPAAATPPATPPAEAPKPAQ